MGLMDILQQYANPSVTTRSSGAHDHFDEVARTAPPDVVGQGVADAFRSDQTPTFGEMVGQMFGRSNPQQQADTLNQLLRSIGPGVLAALGSGILGRLGASANAAVPQVTPQQASQLSPEQVQGIANRAEQHDPSVLDKLGGFYAERPQLVKNLGTAALTIALAGIANRMRARVTSWTAARVMPRSVRLNQARGSLSRHSSAAFSRSRRARAADPAVD